MCVTLFFDMRSYKIESYVPEETFLAGKDARFCRAAFENCFVIDFSNGIKIIASCKEVDKIKTSMADVANVLAQPLDKKEFCILPSSAGTLLIYPAWQGLALSLAFLFKESVEEVEKAYQNAKRYAFSMVFDADDKSEINQRFNLETKLCVLDFYVKHLFGDERETNVTTQILMLANLVGCRLHKTSVSRISVNIDEREMEKISAFLCCAFMTMRRYNGRISTADETTENPSIFAHVPQEYGIHIQQSIKERTARPTPFDLPNKADFASFATHPAFANYRIEETDGELRIHLPIKQKAFLSSVPACGREQELTLTLFPLLQI